MFPHRAAARAVVRGSMRCSLLSSKSRTPPCSKEKSLASLHSPSRSLSKFRSAFSSSHSPRCLGIFAVVSAEPAQVAARTLEGRSENFHQNLAHWPAGLRSPPGHAQDFSNSALACDLESKNPIFLSNDSRGKPSPLRFGGSQPKLYLPERIHRGICSEIIVCASRRPN